MLSTMMLAYPKNVTINADSRPAEKVFAEIVVQSGHNYIYSPDLLKGLKVTVHAKNEPLESVLKRMFSGTGIAFTIKGNNVVLKKEKKAKGKESEARRHSVSGFVKEEESGEPIAGAIVRDRRTGKATITNANGFYTLSLPQGETTLQASSFDYIDSEPSEIHLFADKSHDFSLGRSRQLEEVVITASNEERHALHSSDVGSSTLSIGKINAIPAVFGERDVIKSLQLDPGVSAGVEGLAGMYVHGGNADENLYMLDNIPLYQVNHLGGLFSTFNPGVLRNVDFYKSSFPAKYDGRISSFIDVHTKDGRTDRHLGEFSLGLTSGNLSVDGPIGKDGKTSYSFGIRRSWLDVLTTPMTAIINATQKEDHVRFGYAFTDLNAKITHRFSDRSKAWLSIYYGEDYLRGGTKWTPTDNAVYDIKEDTWLKLNWGNILVSAGWNRVLSPKLFAEFNASFTRYFSKLKNDENTWEIVNGKETSELHDLRVDKNSINDWNLRASFDWRPSDAHHAEFGASMTFHSFVPSQLTRHIKSNDFESFARNDGTTYNAIETNAYFGDDWTLSDRLRMNAGIHASLFHIDGKTHGRLSPRLSLSFSPTPTMALKASYSRAVQYVHQLNQSYISLPTDKWVPITGDFRPKTSDKIAIGGYKSIGKGYVVSLEGYYKWMHNILDYTELYYLIPPAQGWDDRLTSGKGTSKGIDFKLTKSTGKLTGHVSYSLMWADRQFDRLNGGKAFPARFDNRHKINILCSWKINPTWEINASWTGMSGNRFTLPTQMWQGPGLSDFFYSKEWGTTNVGDSGSVPLIKNVNNYRLPFYHRLDLGIVRHTQRGYWTISIYNAYCHKNIISIRPGINNAGKPVFQKLSILPIIPSFSYTWLF